MRRPGNLSADDQNWPVAQVDHLVRRAAQNQPGKVTPPARTHHDDTHVVLVRSVDDVAGRVPEHGVIDYSVSLDSRRCQRLDGGRDASHRLVVGLGRHEPGTRHDLSLAQVNHPDLALGQGRQVLGCRKDALRRIRVVQRYQQSLIHGPASSLPKFLALPWAFAIACARDLRPDSSQRRPSYVARHKPLPYCCPGIQSVPASGTFAIAAASTVSATRSSGSRWWTSDLPHARAMAVSSMVSALR